MKTNNNNNRTKLHRTLTMKDIIALAFGTMIGWGWIMLAGSWVESGGVLGAILAFCIGGILAIFVGLTYAELTPALPLAGGELVFTYRAMGYKAAWFTGWMITLAYIGVAAWEGPALANALNFLFGNLFPTVGNLWSIQGSQVTGMFLLIGCVGAIIMTILNYRGAKASAIFQTTATIAMAIGGIAFFLGSAIKGNIQNITPLFTDGKGFVAVLLAVPAMFVGFDVLPQAAEEMNIPLGKIGKVMIIAICLAAAWYIMMIMGVALSAPSDIISQFNADPSSVPLASSFAYALGHPIFGKLIIISAICGIMTSWNGFMVGASRVIFSMSRAKMLPTVFAKLHPKYGSPTAAILLIGTITVLSPMLGKSALSWLVNAASFGTVVAYFMVALSYCILQKKEPNLKRPFKVKHGKVVGFIAVAVTLFFISLYLPIYSPTPLLPIEWCLVGGWVLLGLILFFINQFSKNGKTPEEEIEYQLFGEQYKRF